MTVQVKNNHRSPKLANEHPCTYSSTQVTKQSKVKNCSRLGVREVSKPIYCNLGGFFSFTALSSICLKNRLN